MDSNSDVKLSRGILEMKFMKKTKERVDKEEEDAEGKAMYAIVINEAMKKGQKIAFIESSITGCKDLVDGRMSFGGMNPNIEKLMDEEYKKKYGKLEQAKESEISDIDMTKTLNKRFQTKKQRAKHDAFAKPQNVDSFI